LTALCYFNALRELGGARRIVEDEVRAKLADYGTRRRRLDPKDQPFEDRGLHDVLELTSRESTDKVAAANGQAFDQHIARAIRVAAVRHVPVSEGSNAFKEFLEAGKRRLAGDTARLRSPAR
jgi:hypothetical protein